MRSGQRGCLLPASLPSAPCCLFFSQGRLHRNKLAPSFTLTHLLCLPLKNEEFVAGFSPPVTLCAGGQQQWPQSAAQINGPKHDTRELPGIKEFLRRGFIFPLEPQSLVIWSKHKGCPEFPVSLSLLAAGELGDALGHLVPALQHIRLWWWQVTPPSLPPGTPGPLGSAAASGFSSGGGDTHLAANLSGAATAGGCSQPPCTTCLMLGGLRVLPQAALG